jgi:N-acetylneuraminate synthase
LASIEPLELGQLVIGIRSIEQALGRALKGPAGQEMANRQIARRSLVAAQPIRKGELLTRDMLTAKRPATGRSPMELWDLLGRAAGRDYKVDDLIE